MGAKPAEGGREVVGCEPEADSGRPYGRRGPDNGAEPVRTPEIVRRCVFVWRAIPPIGPKGPGAELVGRHTRIEPLPNRQSCLAGAHCRPPPRGGALREPAPQGPSASS